MSNSTRNQTLPGDAAVDLHLHTTYSDGVWTLEALLDHLVHQSYALAAITDHDRTDTAAVIQALASEKHLPVLVAVEMSTTWQGEMTDLLCYGFDPDQNALSSLAQEALRRQQENTRAVYENLLRQGYNFPPDALASILDKPGAQQPHALVALLEGQGFGSDGGQSTRSAGEMVMQAGCEFATNDPAAVVHAAHSSGAVCLLAHPGRADGFKTFDLEALDQFRQEIPIDGLEVYYPLHTPAQTAMYRAYAEQHDLLISAGSDSHRPEKPPIPYQAKLIRRLLERLSILLRE